MGEGSGKGEDATVLSATLEEKGLPESVTMAKIRLSKWVGVRCLSTRPYQQRPLMNKTLSRETTVCETQMKVYMYGCVSEWVGSVCVCVCVCVLFVGLFQDDLRWLFNPLSRSLPYRSVCTSPTRRVLTILPSPDLFAFDTLSCIRFFSTLVHSTEKFLGS